MKQTYYFSHDYNARSDQKIKMLIAKHGYFGYGLFWAIIEDLYNNTNVLRLDYDCMAFDYRTTAEVMKSVINDFGLFVVDADNFSSSSVQKRLDLKNEKSQKARESISKRWGNDTDTNVLPSKNDSNTLKESKGNEKKEKKEKKEEFEARKLKFALTLEPFLQNYGRPLLNDFYKFWTEPNKSGTKFRQESQTHWNLERRLETWANREKDFKKTPEPEKIIKSSLIYK